MKNIRAIVAGLALTFSTGDFAVDDVGVKFPERDLKFDAFGTWASRDRKNFSDDSFGVGAGVSYYVTRYFGAGMDSYTERVDWPNHLDFSALARYPFEGVGVAPYVLAGFGRQFSDVPQWSAHLGAGVEMRLQRTMGIFGEIRGVFPDRTRDFTLLRMGVRIGF